MCVFTNLAAMMITRADHCACKAMDKYHVHLHNNTFVLCVVHVPTNKRGFGSILLNTKKLKGYFTHVLSQTCSDI